MINLLIVDDQDYSIDYIKSVILSHKLDISNIYTATDGSTALNIIYSNPIDIILTDVKMPIMDGITLAKEVRKYSHNHRIIFMSAYSEKEYLKSAIKLKAIDYIEKPINVEELIETLEEVIKCINNTDNTQQFLMSSDEILNSIKSSLAKDLTRTISDYSEIIKKILMCKLEKIDNMWCVTGLIKFVNNTSYNSNDFNHNIDVMKKSLPVNDNICVLSCLKNNNIILFHIFSDDKSNLTYKNLSYIYEFYFNNIYSYDVLASLGTVELGMKNTHTSYQTAVINLDACLIRGYNTISMSSSQTEEYSFDYNDIEKILNNIANEDKNSALDIFNNIYDTLLKFPYTSSYKTKSFFTSLFEKLYNIYGPSNEHIVINEVNTIHEIKIMFINFIDHIFNEQRSKYSPSVQRVIKYIKENYSNEKISLSEISNHVSLSVSWLSVVFKNETGKTINQYITECKIQKAKELLSSTNDIINAIAHSVGFADTKHFFKTFKKLTGFSPSEYRKHINKQKG